MDLKFFYVYQFKKLHFVKNYMIYKPWKLNHHTVMPRLPYINTYYVPLTYIFNFKNFYTYIELSVAQFQ